jgi:predicted molibdopterin-dependent oxidoreductase YjgC
VATLTIDGQTIEAPDGAPLVEVLKKNGFYVSNLCYIDGLPPYAGCRTCLVEIEGARGLQLSCTSTVRDGMEVRSNTDEVKKARQYVLSIINANHSDRCLSCHRRVKCMPGDVCLRDDVVTHRCLTCSKNYRCELQTTNILIDMGDDNIEPWQGEERSYYETEPPEPDRANPWVEFDPQMCIICTRCVRACDDLRHTKAITLAGRGFTTRIAFGAGGRIDESSCDFCGSCIDVCPTATLMEKPNKWLARTEDWVSTVCNSCSVGCTISIGHRDGKPVIVKPDRINPFSDDQICVRGRFHYDGVSDKDRLSQHMIRNGDSRLERASWEDALDAAADRLADVHKQHGGEAIAFLGSPIATNEENYLLQRLAREVAGSPNVDFSQGPVNRAVANAVAAAFGDEALPSNLADIPSKAKTIVVIADDLEESHNIASLRIKDAVEPRKLPLREPARLIVFSPKRSELCDFAEPYGGVWLRPEVGQEAQMLGEIAGALAANVDIQHAAGEAGLDAKALAAAARSTTGIQAHAVKEASEALADGDEPQHVDQILDEADAMKRASDILAEAADDREQHIAIVFAARPHGAALAGETAKAAANIALLLRGREAARSFYVMPTEANVNGARDMGVGPDIGPGHLPLANAGRDFTAIIEGTLDGSIKALVVAGDNPLMFAPGRSRIAEALGKLDALMVIDQLFTDTARQAHVVLASEPSYSKDGTYTNADRRVGRVRPAQSIPGDARPGWQTLAELGGRLAQRLGSDARFAYEEAADVTNEIAVKVPGYELFVAHGFFGWSKSRAVKDEPPEKIALQPITPSSPSANGDGKMTLLTGRSLFLSLEGAAVHSPDADKLHREDGVFVNQYDAAEMGIAMGDDVIVRNGVAELALRATLTNGLPRGSVFIPAYLDGGAVTALLPSESGPSAIPRVTLVKSSVESATTS